ncbi:MAG: dTMP kinase [Firmicutes bacterium]|nr:dTMP kinase [Bacillota bacterium]MCL1953864.1 dTMP kinase [Bacillota bacterium]
MSSHYKTFERDTLFTHTTHTFNKYSPQLKGKLITFEGVDFAGKTTQIKLISDCLTSNGIPNLITHQPYDPNIRNIILSKKVEANLSPIAELLLYMADRTQHCNEVIKPAIDKGTIVLCDRFIDSSVAYQGYGRGIDINFIDILNAQALQGLEVDCTIFLDVDKDSVSHRRGNQQLDKMESMGSLFFERVYKGFVELCNKYDRIHKVDGTRSKTTVCENILDILRKVILYHIGKHYEMP